MAVKTRKVPRKELGEVFKGNLRIIQAFEDAQDDIGSGDDEITAIKAGDFLLLAADDQFANARTLGSSSNIVVTDGGAGGTVTADLVDVGTAGGYGNSSSTVRVTIDAKGRVTNIGVLDLQTINVAEVGNLYYTDARARAAISGSGRITYSAGSGVIGSSGFTGTGAYTNFTISNGIIVSAS